jgi:hypothetical protein
LVSELAQSAVPGATLKSFWSFQALGACLDTAKPATSSSHQKVPLSNIDQLTDLSKEKQGKESIVTTIKFWRYSNEYEQEICAVLQQSSSNNCCKCLAAAIKHNNPTSCWLPSACLCYLFSWYLING